MSARQSKIEKSGYSVTINLGWKNGEMSVSGYTAKKGTQQHKGNSITDLHKQIFGY